MKYEVGEKVFIINSKNDAYDIYFNDENKMDKWLGEIMTVVEVRSGHYKMAEDNNYWTWFPKMIDDERTKLLKSSVPLMALDPGSSYYEIVHHHSDKLAKTMFRITDYMSLECSDDGENWYKFEKSMLTLENYRFVKTSEWNYGETYYYIQSLVPYKVIGERIWIDSTSDHSIYNTRNIFRTRETAEAILKKIEFLIKKEN